MQELNTSGSDRLHAGPTQQLVSESIRLAFSLYAGCITMTIGIFGMISNSVNIVVFYKLGFSKPTNICFFTLAIADWLSIGCMFMTNLSNVPGVQKQDMVVYLRDLSLLLAPVFYACSSFGSWVTTVISIERSCCVVFPMKVKQIFTRNVVTTLLLVMVVYEVGTVTPYFWAFRLTRAVNPYNNKTILVLDRFNQNVELAVLVSFLSFSVPTFICFSLVIVATIFLITTFKSSRLRRAAMTGTDPAKSSKDDRLIVSVILVCVIYIFGFSLNILKFLVSLIMPSFQFMDPYLGNLNALTTIFALMFQTAASSVNIFVYMRMNTNFRELLVGCKIRVF